jgi:hypothetical protein
VSLKRGIMLNLTPVFPLSLVLTRERGGGEPVLIRDRDGGDPFGELVSLVLFRAFGEPPPSSIVAMARYSVGRMCKWYSVCVCPGCMKYSLQTSSSAGLALGVHNYLNREGRLDLKSNIKP